MLLLFGLILQLEDRYASLYANQLSHFRGPYQISSINRTPMVTLVDVELHQVASVPELKRWGDKIKQSKAPNRPIMIQFFQGTRSDSNLLANYQDGTLYLSRIIELA